MSIQSEITRISANVTAALAAIARKGVTVPSGSNSDDLEDLIDAISAGGGSAISIVDELDSHGGIIRHITAVDLSGDTVAADKMLADTTAHNAQGQPVTGGIQSQAAQTIHPSSSDQTIAAGKYLAGAQTIKAVTLANLLAANIKKDVVIKVGDSIDDDCVASVTGTYEGASGKNIQYAMGRSEISATSYTATSLSITVSKAGTYKCYWTMDRNTTSGTSGSQLYKNGSAVGTAHTTWTYNNNQRYGMNCEETLTLAKNDVLVVRCRSRSTSYICGAENLIIVEQ